MIEHVTKLGSDALVLLVVRKMFYAGGGGSLSLCKVNIALWIEKPIAIMRWCEQIKIITF